MKQYEKKKPQHFIRNELGKKKLNVKIICCSSLVRPQYGVVDPPDVEVLHIDIPVGGSLPLAPEQQTLLGRSLCMNIRGRESERASLRE